MTPYPGRNSRDKSDGCGRQVIGLENAFAVAVLTVCGAGVRPYITKSRGANDGWSLQSQDYYNQQP